MAFLLLIATVVQGEKLALPRQIAGIPLSATILEARALPGPLGERRAIVLWMIDPVRHPREYPEEMYTCPEETRGHYFEGPTRVSLLDLENNMLLNTVEVESPYDESQDSFTLPYLIHQGRYYLVERVISNGEGPPTILAFRDVNLDGREHEFVLFEAMFCMGRPTMLIGYSREQDLVIKYPVHLKFTGPRDSGVESESSSWTDYLFVMQPTDAGLWRYSIDYSARGGCEEAYEVRYDAATESFVGTLAASACAE